MPSPALYEISAQLARSNPTNRTVQSLLHDRLAHERDRLAAHNVGLIGFLEAALILVRSMHNLGADEAGTVRDMASRLVGLASDHCVEPSSLSAPKPARPASDQGIQTLNRA